MRLMLDGVWRGDVAAPGPELDARRAIHAGLFRGRVTPDPASAHPAAENGRYHLFVSYAFPFAHRTILARLFAGLEHAAGMSVLHPTWNTPEGWLFGETTFSTPDLSGQGFTRLHQAYAASASRYTGKVTGPALWDRAAGCIVFNESRDIVHMLDGPLRRASGAGRGFDLYPEPLRADIDRLDDRIASDLAGVYAFGGARDQAEYDAAEGRLFAFLADLEHRPGDGRPFLHGACPTTSDVLAFTPLVRFDPAYNPFSARPGAASSTTPGSRPTRGASTRCRAWPRPCASTTS